MNDQIFSIIFSENTSKHYKRSWDRLDLEMERNQGKDETLEILDQVIENSEPLWITALLNIKQRADLGTLIFKM
jgi:hypothetical protein